MIIETYNENETFFLGLKIAKKLYTGVCVCIDGDLGTGKSVLVKGIAKGMGIDEIITSPTYNIVNEYKGVYKLKHFDLYKIAYSDELEEIGIYEYLEDSVCVFEWPDKIKEIINKECVDIKIEKDLNKGVDYRKITIESKEIFSEDSIV